MKKGKSYNIYNSDNLTATNNTPKNDKTKDRRTGIKRGEVRQKPFTFRIDNENLYYLESLGIKNKGRFINEAIQYYIKYKKL